MNHYKARQRKSDQRWDFTCGNDDHIRPVGYCHDFIELDNDPVVGKFYSENDKKTLYANKDKYHTSGHDTPEEACECYKKYVMDNSVRIFKELDAMRKCKICGEWTLTRVSVGFSAQTILVLCQGHIDPQSISSLININEFWSS